MGSGIFNVLLNVNHERFSGKPTTHKMTSIMGFFQCLIFVIGPKFCEVVYLHPQKKGAEQLVGCDRKICS